MSILNIYKRPNPRGYATGQFFIEDRSETSPFYFDVVDLPSTVGGGKNTIVIKGNGTGLRLGSTIDVEIIDAAGDNVFCEFTSFIDRFNNYYITFDIYDITAKGLATVYLVGEAAVDLEGNPIPRQFQNRYNVRWQRSFYVNPTNRNSNELIFDRPPNVGVTQVYAPARLQTQATASGYIFNVITSSIDQLSITTADFVGYDRDFSTSTDILDTRIKNISINPLGIQTTANSVDTTIRKVDTDIQGGYRMSYTDRFNTILSSTSSFFTKDHLGGIFEFFSSESTPKQISPQPYPPFNISGSAAVQLSKYRSTIVDVLNSTQAVLDRPIILTTTNDNRDRSYSNSLIVRKANQFSGSITFAPSDVSVAESVIVSQSYLEFTFSDLKPISGEVYRIRTYTKRGASTGDFKLLNDQVIKPVEYLTDAVLLNNTNYAKHESDYLLIGHFTSQSILNDYWYIHQEVPNSFDLISGSIDSSVLVNSVALNANYTQSSVLSAQFNQNYEANIQYTLGFNLTLDPFTELEIYMGSTPLSYNVISPAVYPLAFQNDPTNDTRRLAGSLFERRNANPYSPFGKYLGKVVNDSPTRKHYGTVVFDFLTDASGFGRPVLRSRIVDETPNITGSAYVGELSVKPFKLTGYTPEVVQFAVPLTVELATFFSVISQSVDFKIEYYDYTGRQSEYITFLDDVTVNLKGEIPSNTCQAESNFFSFSTANTATVTRRVLEEQAVKSR